MCFFGKREQQNRQAQKVCQKSIFILLKLCYSIREAHRAFSEEDSSP